jgi:hypothetical protein
VAAVVGIERVVVSLCDWRGGNLHVAAQIGGIGVSLGGLAIKPDGVVSGQLWEYSEDYILDETSEQPMNNVGYIRDGRTLFVNLRSDSALIFLASHDSLVDATSEVAIRIAVAFVNDILKGTGLPTHVEVTVVHRTSSVTVREAMRNES